MGQPLITLVEPSEADKRKRDRLTHAEWGKGLTPEQYGEREERLRAHPWSKRVMQTWFLVERGEVLSSCETFRMMSIRHGTLRGHSYGVASVFTEARLRGRGLASELMRKVGDALRSQDHKLHAAILFSDVGEKLYAQTGYEARPGMDRHLPPLPGAQSPVVIPITEPMLSDELAHTPAPEVPFLIWPTPDQIDWHLERERIYAEKMARTRPPSIGARVGHSTIFWCVYFASDVLSVLLMNVYSPDDARLLLREAQRAAAVAGVSKVQLWESAAIGPWQEALAGVAPVEREGYLPMLRPFAEEVNPTEWNIIPRALWI